MSLKYLDSGICVSGNNKMVKYSIIIPHHNSFNLLKRCLDSIPKDETIQIIVVDDNSDDKNQLERVIDAYPYIHFVSLTENGGGGKARNEGLKVAIGKWLIFADADDYFVDNAFSVFNEYADSKNDIVYFKSESRDSNTGIPSDRAYIFNILIDGYRPHDKYTENSLRYRYYVPWGKMIKRNMVCDNGICFEEIKYSNDIMFSAKIGYHAIFIAADKRIVYCVTTRSESLTRNMDRSAVMCRYEATLRYNHFLKMVGAGRNRAVIMRYLVLGLKINIPCVFEMIEKGLKNRTNFFAGWRRWGQIFNRNRRQISHF